MQFWTVKNKTITFQAMLIFWKRSSQVECLGGVRQALESDRRRISFGKVKGDSSSSQRLGIMAQGEKMHAERWPVVCVRGVLFVCLFVCVFVSPAWVHLTKSWLVRGSRQVVGLGEALASALSLGLWKETLPLASLKQHGAWPCQLESSVSIHRHESF